MPNIKRSLFYNDLHGPNSKKVIKSLSDELDRELQEHIDEINKQFINIIIQ